MRPVALDRMPAEFRHLRARQEGLVVDVALRSLSPADTERLVDQLLLSEDAGNARRAHALKLVGQHAQGNPLMVEMTVQAAVSSE